MKTNLALLAAAAAILVVGAADAHSLKLECKKVDAGNVVCRTITSDGEVARGVEVQLLASDDYKVLAGGKTNAEGKYTFKAPTIEYHIVAIADKAHVASMSNEDIW